MASHPDAVVSAYRGAASYPTEPPYHPAEAYPELPGVPVASSPNPAFDAVRQALRLAGLDAERFGTPAWNPIGDLVEPGGKVLLKPNWVLDRHPHGDKWGEPDAMDCLVTHPSLIRAVLEYVQIALGGHGAITVADAPLQATDFDALQARLHMAAVCRAFDRDGAVPVDVVDMRLEVAIPHATLVPGARTYTKERREIADGHQIVDLGAASCLEPISTDYESFRVTCYDHRDMRDAHRPGVHRYCIGRPVLEADLVIDLPKLKTHKKAGLTVALKNLVGINGHKSFLPHHRKGSIHRGGDEYLTRDPLKWASADLQDAIFHRDTPGWQVKPAVYSNSALAALNRLFRDDATHTGSWYGNDTIWRTCLDLNRVLLYGTAQGGFVGAEAGAPPQRTVLHIVDGILAGDQDGPLDPRPRPVGVVLCGRSAAHVDLVAARLMGFDWRRIPLVKGSFSVPGAQIAGVGPEALEVRSNVGAWRRTPGPDWPPQGEHLDFQAATGWEGAIEDRDGLLPHDASVRPAGVLWKRLGRLAPRPADK